MKVVILAGGMGTRIKEFTKTIPKPMIVVNKKPKEAPVPKKKTLKDRGLNVIRKQNLRVHFVCHASAKIGPREIKER